MRNRDDAAGASAISAGGQTVPPPTGLPPGVSMTWFIVVLGILTMFGPMAIDMYLPGLPAIGRDLGADQATVQLTLSLFLIGYGVAQLMWGPMGDRFGRRKPAAVGVALFIISSAGCALAGNIWVLAGWRMMQGIGACAAPVLARAMVRDAFDRDKGASVMSLMMLVMGAAPLVAPVIGGQILTHVGWRGIFWLLCAFGFIAGLGLLTLPETKPVSSSGGNLLRNYLTLLGNRRYLGYALSGGFVSAGMFAYISGTPFIYIEYFKVAPEHFGFLFGVNVLAMMMMSVVNSRLVLRLGVDRLMMLGLFATAATGLVLLILAVTGTGGIVGIAIPLFCYLGWMGLVGANSMAGSMSIFPHLAGSASALSGAMQLCLGAGAGALVGLLSDGTPLPMCLVLAGCALTGLLFHRLLVK